MNQESSALKLLFWAAGIAIICSGTFSLTRATYIMAEAAFAAQEHPLSYGQYSRMLWGSARHVPKRHRHK